jgi:hypothetical protein
VCGAGHVQTHQAYDCCVQQQAAGKDDVDAVKRALICKAYAPHAVLCAVSVGGVEAVVHD